MVVEPAFKKKIAAAAPPHLHRAPTFTSLTCSSHHHPSNNTVQVWKARKSGSLQTVAVKSISKAGKNDKDLLSLRQEIDILRKLRHPGIIEMLDSFETKTDFCVVTEFAQGPFPLLFLFSYFLFIFLLLILTRILLRTSIYTQVNYFKF